MSELLLADAGTAETISGRPAADRIDSAGAKPGRPALVWRLMHGIDLAWDWVFGVLSLVVGLAWLASFPVLQLLSLGYLLETSGRVARRGRITSAAIGVRQAAQVGSLVAAGWLLLWIPRLLSSLWADAVLIDPTSRAATILQLLVPLTAGWVVLHVGGAVWRGGRLRHFLWPRPVYFLRGLTAPNSWQQVCDATWQFLVGLRLPYYFWLGLRGLVGGLIWLVIPTSLLLSGLERPVLGILGGLSLAFVVLWLPLLLARMAATNRFLEVFAVRRAIGTYVRAPVSSLLAIAATLLFSVPLYLLKIELIPREAVWLPSLLFIVSMWPARVLAGWAVARARHEPRRWWWTAVASVDLLLLLAPLALAYVVVVYLTQYLSWYGMWSLYEQHAFLVPVPFLGG